MGGPGSNPCGHQGVVLSTMGEESMDTETVLASTVCAHMGRGLVGPEGGVVGIT